MRSILTCSVSSPTTFATTNANETMHYRIIFAIYIHARVQVCVNAQGYPMNLYHLYSGTCAYVKISLCGHLIHSSYIAYMLCKLKPIQDVAILFLLMYILLHNLNEL